MNYPTYNLLTVKDNNNGELAWAWIYAAVVGFLKHPTVEVQKQHVPRFKYSEVPRSTSETDQVLLLIS